MIRKILKKPLLVGAFMLYYLKEVILANLKIAYDVLTPRHLMKPGVLIIPIEVHSPLELLVLVNLVTMTPGSLAIDISPDQKAVYIHAMYVDDPDKLRDEMQQGFLKRVREIFQ